MPILPRPTTRTLLVIRFDPPLPFLLFDADHLAGARGSLRCERRLKRRKGVLRATDRRRLSLQRARDEIGEFLAERPSANSIEFRPVSGVWTMKLVARNDAKVRESVLDMNDASITDDRHSFVDVERRLVGH